ncbi:hypothetical protein M408DRAFT_146396 [Serendipita vermifera MAFF 305830]|uniref:Uncharacterized protein n=1 Tax=Serendipita vermifera MAFF 305830 TaxID=933852 RepID=A0A0C3B717_SERVB|nr:hypothetical protein M408DRAFT_146396 [Serendipita vermifera MAFF 305830]
MVPGEGASIGQCDIPSVISESDFSQEVTVEDESEREVTPSLSDSDPEAIEASSGTGYSTGTPTIRSFNRRSVSLEIQKKTRNFSRPTCPSMLLQRKKSTKRVEGAYVEKFVPVCLRPLARPLLPLPPRVSAKTDDKNDTEASSKPHVGNSVSLGLSIASLTSTPLVAIVPVDTSSAAISPNKARATGMLSSLKESASGLSRLKRNLPIGVSKSSAKAPPIISGSVRKSSEQVRPTTDTRALYSKPAFSKSLPHIKSLSQRQPLVPLPLPIMPINGAISAETMARSDAVRGSIPGTLGSSQAVYPIRKPL